MGGGSIKRNIDFSGLQWSQPGCGLHRDLLCSALEWTLHFSVRHLAAWLMAADASFVRVRSSPKHPSLLFWPPTSRRFILYIVFLLDENFRLARCQSSCVFCHLISWGCILTWPLCFYPPLPLLLCRLQLRFTYWQRNKVSFYRPFQPPPHSFTSTQLSDLHTSTLRTSSPQ